MIYVAQFDVYFASWVLVNFRLTTLLQVNMLTIIMLYIFIVAKVVRYGPILYKNFNLELAFL